MIKIKNYRFLMLLVLFLNILSSKIFAEPLDNWHWRNPLPQGNDLEEITYGNSTFVAVGLGGTILTSPDGMTWASRLSGTTNWLSGVTYGNNTFVAVGGWGSGKILTSSDGITWTNRTSGTNDDLFGVTYGNNTFVAVGEGGKILTSSDGITWTGRTLMNAPYLLGVTYGNNTFVSVGLNGEILTSSDGITWTSRTGATNSLSEVTYGNNTFVAVGWAIGTILTSSDGITWTSRTSGVINILRGVTYGNNAFVAVGLDGIILQSDPFILPVISVLPTGLNFDSVNVGSSSLVKTITVKNIGLSSLIVGTISKTGSNAAEFIIQNDNCSGQTIAPSASRTIDIVLSPQSVGAKTANLLIPSNDSNNSTVTVLLSGYGLKARNQSPQVNLAAIPSSGQAPLMVNFTASAQDDGTIAKYEWDFDGNGSFDSTTNGNTISHTYNNAGTYIVKVKVTDNEGATGETSITINVTLHPSSSQGNIDTTSPGSADRIDGHDLYILSKAFGANPQSANWNSVCDLDGNNIVDGNDLVILAGNFGK